MIKQASFPQPFEIEEDDPIYEINPVKTTFITDLPKEIQARIESYTGSRKVTQKRFNIANRK